MSKVSFGALAKAQAALSKDQSADRKRKRGQDTSKSSEDKLEALRERLRQIKADKLATGAAPTSKSKTTKKTKTKTKTSRDEDDQDAQSDSDSDGAPKSRSNKHAPAVQSSKRMVSRKRQVVEVKKPVFRDPRFDSINGPKPDENTIANRYGFLNDYRKAEISELRATIRKTKNEGEKEKLKKQLLSMESQQKTRENKEAQQEVIRKHKQKEKELVKQGKQPFYLKKCTSWPSSTYSTCRVLTLNCSRAKEDCPHRPLPEDEVEAARQGHRAPSQEDHVQGAQEHARGTSRRLISSLPSWWPWHMGRAGGSLTICKHRCSFQTCHDRIQPFWPLIAAHPGPSPDVAATRPSIRPVRRCSSRLRYSMHGLPTTHYDSFPIASLPCALAVRVKIA